MRKKTEVISLISQNPSITEGLEQENRPVPFGTDDELLRVDEAARLLGLSVGTVYHLIAQRRIPCIKLSQRCVRFSLPKIRQWLAELSEPARVAATKRKNVQRKES